MNYRVTPVRFRLFLQGAFTLFCIYVGYRFAGFLTWALGKSDVFVSKPGAVEGFLPISALLGLKQLAATGQWDMVHPAGLTIFLALIVMVFLFRKGFCAYICPVGFLSNLLDRLGRSSSLSLVPPKFVNYPLLSLKYILLGGFGFSVMSMDLRSVQAFITGPYNMVADARMLGFFTSPSALSLMVIGGLVVFSLVVRNGWCRYLCPYGALLGLASWLSPVAVHRDGDSCVGCGKCTKACPAGISVETKKSVRTPECIGCMECVGSCPVEGCLDVAVAGRYRIPWQAVGVGAVVVLLVFWGWAKATGHWDSTMPSTMLKKMYSTFLGSM